MNVDWELDDLKKVFKTYRFNTEQWFISRKNSHLKLKGKALDIVKKHDDRNDLVIVYYDGHAFINNSRQALDLVRSFSSPQYQYYLYAASRIRHTPLSSGPQFKLCSKRQP
jgi:hypothetical protein